MFLNLELIVQKYVSTETEKDFKNLVKLIKILILDKSYVLDKNKNFSIKNHNYSNFKSEILRFYSSLSLDKN